ncbi:hypothetical protein XENTR_v10011209 [Xenopus tropicalis]|nr:hypothetical protein XENTR_v10011209 [Xenopus tropicalis]
MWVCPDIPIGCSLQHKALSCRHCKDIPFPKLSLPAHVQCAHSAHTVRTLQPHTRHTHTKSDVFVPARRDARARGGCE